MKSFILSVLALLVGTIPAAQADAVSGDSYHLQQLEMAKAWQLTRGSPLLKVAIVSTGVNYRLSEISSAIALNPGEMGNGRETDGIDNDGNGYIDDVMGANTYTGSGDPLDGFGIGTYEASLVVSPSLGLAPQVKIIPIAVCNETGSCTDESILKGIQYARNRGANLIYLGLGGVKKDPGAFGALCDGIRGANVPVIAPAGNDGADLSVQGRPEMYFAADCDARNLITVATTDESSKLAYFSNYGFDRVQVAAPGVGIPGFSKIGKITKMSGGSVSGIITTAVAALVLSYHPEYSVFQLKEALIRGADLEDALSGKVSSGGRLNAYKALTVAVP